MRTLKRVLLTASTAALALSAWTGSARAQLDIDPPLPNVLLMIDTSGTMEYLIKPDSTGANVLPGTLAGTACDSTTVPTEQNRWTSLVSVLTGTIDNFKCQATPRNTAAFKAEYGLGVNPPPASWLAPYDWSYYLPFNRMYSNGCTPGPGVQSSNWYDWPAGSIAYHDALGNACSTWSQKSDGLLDTFRDRVRFGMMTFDTLPDQSTGLTSGSLDYKTGMQGMWSYYSGWNPGSGSYAQGYPPNCASAAFEVGARNPAAPPWEGRLIPFGAWDAPLTGAQSVRTTNDHIQEALIAMRPYGATPISGMFEDARTFFNSDTDPDPNTPNRDFGPHADPYFVGGCRKQYIIFLTDGANGPDYDLRPSCNQAGGVCPYQPAVNTAQALAGLPGNSAIETFVVGFAVSNPAALGSLVPPLASCTELDQSNQSICANPPAALVPCCNLSKLAIAGGTQHAYFADDPVALQQTLSNILGNISKGSTARTIPVFAPVSTALAQGGGALAAGYRFVAQFSADASGHLWRGQIQRQRYVCNAVPPYQDTVISSGDEFGENVDFDDPNRPRQFWSFVAPKIGTLVASDQIIRPGLVVDDGLGTYAQGASGMTPQPAGTFIATMAATSAALGIDPVAPPAACATAFAAGSGSICADKLLQWEVGTSPWPKTRNKAVCASNNAVCSKLGSIYHSTPAVSTPPRELLRDDTYDVFAAQQAKRPIMLYTATTDGQLHGFEISASDPADPYKVDSLSNNELWSFFPPTVLPNLLGSYDRQALLLDGAPVVADVAGQVLNNTLPPVYERRRGLGVQWSSVLVAGGGSAGGFYYAVDVTDPKAPRFLWQLSKDQAGVSLFGDTTSTPAIATITLADTGTDVKEVAVAILPGGTEPAVAGPCQPTLYQSAHNPNTSNPISLMKDPAYQERSQVRCWKSGAGRSLTIVRLDSGEVLMNFRGTTATGPVNLLAQSPVRAQVVPMASPITGVPVAYPGQTGQVANRVYVGDADGVLWRVDLSGTDPTKWSMSIAWDGYSLPGDTVLSGEVIQTPPVISTNPYGDTVILFSTGDQEQLSASTMNTRVWSILEKRDAPSNSFQTTGNWYFDFPGGERVTGPMSIFDSVAYFSTFAPNPPGAPVCSFGISKIWALDYQTAAPRFPNGNSTKQYETADNTVIAGVAVTKTPSCETIASSTDPYLGAHSYVSNANAGVYQLVWQKGPGAGITTNNAVKTDPFTGIQSMNLQAPRQSTRIDSWATIIE
jgi:type IV pilus assembly protein PilY1